MGELLHDLSVWVVGFAESDWAIIAIALISFSESIFFPIPPDPLLISVGLTRPETAIFLGVLAAISSVFGAVVGHWLGKKMGRPLLHRLFSKSSVVRVESALNRYGVWATLLAAITPVPYKVFAIAAGVLNMERRTFILASLIGRGARFISVGILIFIYGESIKSFMEKNMGLLSILLASIVMSLGVIWAILRNRNTSSTN